MSAAEAASPAFRGGTGAPLLLVHGLGGHWQVWEPLLDQLVAHHDVAAPDLPGFGAAPPLAEPHTPGALADAVVGHLDELGWSRPHVVGQSLGGLIALELARRGRAATVTAISPAGMQRGWEDAWVRRTLRTQHRLARALRPLIPAVAATAPTRTLALGLTMARPWRADATWTAEMVAAFAAAPAVDDALDHIGDQDTTDHLAAIDVPVTIAWGTRDRLLAPRQAPRFLAALPTARLVRLDGLGHQPMTDDPQAVVDVILRTSGAVAG